MTTGRPRPDQILKRLKLRDLQMFASVVEAGSMARAAEQLSITRPVVSKTIADLERVVGLRLLDRTREGIEPTAFGRALLRRSMTIFDELRQSVQELEFLANSGRGELHIGCSEYMAAGLVPRVIDQLSRQFPELRFQLSLGDANSLQTHGLRERKVEFAIARMLAPQAEPDMKTEVLFHERVFVAAGADHKWSGRRAIKLAELVNEPWILAPPEIVEGSPIVEAFRAIGLRIPEAKVIGLSLPLRNGLLATGRFLTIVPESVLRFGAERNLLRALPVDVPRWPYPVAIFTHKNRTLSPLATLFIDCARKIAGPLSGRSSRRGL